MSCRRPSVAKTRRDRRTEVDAVAGFAQAAAAKALVMRHACRLVADGHAEWLRLETGDIRLRFHTGETFVLAETTITRIA